MSGEAAYALLEDFIQTNAFIHDDVLLDWDDDLDEYARHALILDPPVVVLNTIAGLGHKYLDRLRNDGLVQSKIVVPVPSTESVITNLLLDPVAVAELRTVIQRDRLGLSFFYSDRDVDLRSIAAAVSSAEWLPSISPGIDNFSLLNDKISAHYALVALGIPVPQAEVVTSLAELDRYRRKLENGVYLKPTHHEVQFLAQDEPSDKCSVKRPTLVEAAVPGVQFSPVTNWVSRPGRPHAILGTAQQLLDGPTFSGNFDFPGLLSDAVTGQLADWAREIANSVKEHDGPAGIDSVVTASGDVRVVDLNLRFNSSTYMFSLKHRLSLTNCYVAMEELHCWIESFDEIADILTIPSSSTAGVVAVGPVIEDGKVVRFFAFLSAPTQDEFQQIREKFLSELRRASDAHRDC